MELMEVLRMMYGRKKILLWYEDVFCRGGWMESWDGTGGGGNVRSAGLDWNVIRRGVLTSILWGLERRCGVLGVVRAEEVFRWDRRRVRLKSPRGGGFRKVRRKKGRGWRLFWLW